MGVATGGASTTRTLVEATAFSRPAFRYTPRRVVRAMSDPTELTTDMHVMPERSASMRALWTSLVSPLCETARNAPEAASGMSRGPISAASTERTDLNDCSSRMSLAPYWAACREVPHALRARGG